MEQPNNSYIGHHAELYDLFYSEKPYALEARFIDQCIKKYSLHTTPPHILELACGTGSHALELEKLGYQILATDYSPDMLAQARQKAQQSDSKVEFRQQDMRALEVPERPFDAIICLFDSIGYVSTNESILRVLRNVHDHLKADGLFVFEFWHAGAMIAGHRHRMVLRPVQGAARRHPGWRSGRPRNLPLQTLLDHRRAGLGARRRHPATRHPYRAAKAGMTFFTT